MIVSELLWVGSISVSKFKHVNNVVTSINIAILTHHWNIEECSLPYCMHKASIKIIHSLLHLCDMLQQVDYTTTHDQYCTSQLHDQESVKWIYLSHHTISYYNLKYIDTYLQYRYWYQTLRAIIVLKNTNSQNSVLQASLCWDRSQLNATFILVIYTKAWVIQYT